MICANMIAFGLSRPTAKDYIQDRLIAMWDGIENAGWGVHAADATVWKDLSGNKMDCSQNGSYQTPAFSSNSIVMDGSPKSFRFTCNTELANTKGIGLQVEIAAKGAILTNADFGLFTIFPAGSWSFQNSVVVRGAFSGYITIANQYNQRPLLPASAQTSDNNLCVSSAFPSSSSRYFKAYYRGSFFGSDSGTPNRKVLTYGVIGYASRDFPAGFVGDIYCIRLYSRALTAEEIAHNYEIDKARFGLS